MHGQKSCCARPTATRLGARWSVWLQLPDHSRKPLVKYLMWLLKAAIFFTLFAFALNNQQTVSVNFFFGTVWQAPLVLVVLTAFASGLILGVVVMTPRWWKSRQTAKRQRLAGVPAVSEQPSTLHHGI
jgi:lipopolysaccharide assembly protein A